MPDIRDYDNIERIESWIIDNWGAITESFVTETDAPREYVEQLEIQELIVTGEWGRGTQRGEAVPLELLIIFDVDGEITSETEVFQTLASDLVEVYSEDSISSRIDNFTPLPLETKGKFPEINITVAPSDRIESAINRAVQIREEGPNRAYSLTRDEDINVTEEEGIVRGRVGIRTDEDLDSRDPDDIADYPDKGSIISSIKEAYKVAQTEAINSFPDISDDISSLEISNIVEVGEWGSGSAEWGVDKFRFIVFLDLDDGRSPSSIIRFSRATREMEDTLGNAFQPSDLTKQWTSGIEFRVLSVDQLEDVIPNELDDPDEDEAYDIVTNTRYKLTPRETVGFDLVEEEGEGEESPQPQPEPEEPEEPEEVFEGEEEEDEEKTEGERLEDEFPTVPFELRPYAKTESKLEIPAGKETKSVEPREPYDFELELMSQGAAGTKVGGIQEGIGFAIAAQRLGTEEPAATFPRTGIYIKHYLDNQGPSYALEMYNEMVVYTGYVRTNHGLNIKPGTYQSFREYIYRLKEAHERGITPRLIRPLTQQEAASRGFSTVPELPSGTEAPWLERKQYYEVMESNMDHPAWKNITEYIYED